MGDTYVQLPDRSYLQVPEGTDPAAIRSAITKKFPDIALAQQHGPRSTSDILSPISSSMHEEPPTGAEKILRSVGKGVSLAASTVGKPLYDASVLNIGSNLLHKHGIETGIPRTTDLEGAARSGRDIFAGAVAPEILGLGGESSAASASIAGEAAPSRALSPTASPRPTGFPAPSAPPNATGAASRAADLLEEMGNHGGIRGIIRKKVYGKAAQALRSIDSAVPPPAPTTVPEVPDAPSGTFSWKEGRQNARYLERGRPESQPVVPSRTGPLTADEQAEVEAAKKQNAPLQERRASERLQKEREGINSKIERRGVAKGRLDVHSPAVENTPNNSTPASAPSNGESGTQQVNTPVSDYKEPVWPSNYEKGSKTLKKPANGEGGANYSAADLEAFKRQHGIVDTPANTPSSGEVAGRQKLKKSPSNMKDTQDDQGVKQDIERRLRSKHTTPWGSIASND